MKKIAVLIIFLVVITTGCSYKIETRNSQGLQGENKDWKVEYRTDFTTNYSNKDGKNYAQCEEEDKITVTYKKDISELSSVKHLEISYKDSFGGGGSLTVDFNSPPVRKQFNLGGSSAGTHELGDYPVAPENLFRSIMLFSGPSYEMKASATATVKIQVDGKTDTIQLSPVKDPPPFLTLQEQIHNKLLQKPPFRVYSGHASDLSLKLVKCNINIVTDQTISGSQLVTESNKKGQELVPTDLCYEFTIRNEGRKTISGIANELKVKFVPNDKLKEAIKEAVGMNIFEPDSSLGSREFIEGDIFNTQKDCKFTLSFDLSQENPPGVLITPSEEQLEKLLDNASDASFIIMYKDEEAARFDLRTVRP